MTDEEIRRKQHQEFLNRDAILPGDRLLLQCTEANETEAVFRLSDFCYRVKNGTDLAISAGDYVVLYCISQKVTSNWYGLLVSYSFKVEETGDRIEMEADPAQSLKKLNGKYRSEPGTVNTAQPTKQLTLPDGVQILVDRTWYENVRKEIEADDGHSHEAADVAIDMMAAEQAIADVAASGVQIPEAGNVATELEHLQFMVKDGKAMFGESFDASVKIAGGASVMDDDPYEIVLNGVSYRKRLSYEDAETILSSFIAIYKATKKINQAYFETLGL